MKENSTDKYVDGECSRIYQQLDGKESKQFWRKYANRKNISNRLNR